MTVEEQQTTPTETPPTNPKPKGFKEHFRRVASEMHGNGETRWQSLRRIIGTPGGRQALRFSLGRHGHQMVDEIHPHVHHAIARATDVDYPSYRTEPIYESTQLSETSNIARKGYIQRKWDELRQAWRRRRI